MRNKFIFAFILLIFLGTRLYKIADIPKSVYWDEASIGYNAYSITTDLKDEWGKFLPIHFRAFGEFKLPVYIYSTAILVKLIGLNEYAVRLPAVLYTLGTLVVVYLLVKKITDNEVVAILSTFILTLSPWMFIFSRTGYEATAGVFFLLLAVYLFTFDYKNVLFYFLGTVSIIVSIYSYTSFRIIGPLVLAIFTLDLLRNLFLSKSLKKNILIILISWIMFILSLIPVARLFIYDAGFGRASSFALIPGFQQVYDLQGKPHLQITFDRSHSVNWMGNVVTIGKNYLSHFSPNFLFINGDSNSRSQISGHGEIYWIDLPLIILGIYYIIKSKNKYYYIPLIFLLLAPVPASLTKESPHALRTILAAPSLAILSALGVSYLLSIYKKYSIFVLCAIVVVYLLSFEQYVYSFFTIYPDLSASDWQYEYKQIFASEKNGKVTDKYGQPYIFALYYQKYSPIKFRSEVKYNPVNNWGFSTVRSFNGYEFSDK